MIRTVTKLVTNAKNDGHSSIRPWDSDTPDVAGSRRFKARSVIANAKTPSLNASILAVSFSSKLSVLIIGLTGHVPVRFESAPRPFDRVRPRSSFGHPFPQP